MKFREQYPGFERTLAAIGLTRNAFEHIQSAIFDTYDRLAAPLPESSKWKHEKPKHARKALTEVCAFAELLGLTEPLMQYIALACSAHDLGRMVQANKRASTRPDGFDIVFEDDRKPIPYDDNDERHGYESVLLLRPILGLFAETDAGVWLLGAVRHHSRKANPTLEMCGGSEESLALCGIVRDIDKVLGFQDAADYTGNPERKAKERLQNWPKQIETDLAWGTELGRVDPAEFLTATSLEVPIDRQKCRSYEAYMLQFLKWFFGFVRPEMQEVALNEGGPQIVAAYLLRQLEATPEQREQLHVMLKTYRNGVLLRLAT
ncbi:hypothetical protein EPN90_01925 [Patescibacteria group bacterium]|nr:MAG: hypothetical protein EPN90_01925 [Patescibacteria group bacterium]